MQNTFVAPIIPNRPIGRGRDMRGLVTSSPSQENQILTLFIQAYFRRLLINKAVPIWIRKIKSLKDLKTLITMFCVAIANVFSYCNGRSFLQDEELIKECLNPTTAASKEFKLYQRAKHVYSEAARVWKFKQICEENPPDSLKVVYVYS